MSKEEKIVRLIVKLFSGNISPKEKDEIDAWIMESSENKRSFQELKNLWHVTHPVFAPESIDEKAAEREFMEQVKERKLIHSTLFIWWQRVAAILIIPVITLAGYLLYNESFRSDATDIAYQEVTSPFGISSKVNLPDGSTVWLNSGSKLKFPVTFQSNDRNVFLKGEAYFKVKSDKRHPFNVITENLNVQATGTEFNVEAYSADSITAVTLIEGIVNVNMGESVKEKLEPNQRIILNSNTRTYTKIEADGKHWGAWKDGILAFRDEPLEDVFKRIGRTYNVNIQVKDPTISRQLYRATFEGESFDEILKLMQLSAPILYKRIERTKQTNNEFSKEQIEVYSFK